MIPVVLGLAVSCTGDTDKTDSTGADTSTPTDTTDTDTSDTTTDTVTDTDTASDTDTGTTADPSILDLTFDDATSVKDWTVNAGVAPTLTWVKGAGNPDGALEMSDTNTAGGAPSPPRFATTQTVAFGGATDVRLTFDAKLGGPLVGAALHLRTVLPGIAGDNFQGAIQGKGLNEKTWTTYTYDFTGVDDSAGSDVTIDFELALGADKGATGTILIDNIALNVAP